MQWGPLGSPPYEMLLILPVEVKPLSGSPAQNSFKNLEKIFKKFLLGVGEDLKIYLSEFHPWLLADKHSRDRQCMITRSKSRRKIKKCAL